MSKNTAICAVIVVYYPDLEILNKNISAIWQQVGGVVLVNNTPDPLCLAGLNEDVKVIETGRNLGLGAAQNIGMHYAFNLNFEFVVQFDQDTLPADDYISNVYGCFHDLQKRGHCVGLVGANVTDIKTGKAVKPKLNPNLLLGRYEIVNEVLSSGSLIPLGTFVKVGELDEAMFIDLVDFEYCWRIRAEGLLVVRPLSARIYHDLGDGVFEIYGHRLFGICSPFRHYYQFRNTLMLVLSGRSSLLWSAKNVLKLLFKLIFFPILLDRGFLRLRFMLKGLLGAIMGRGGAL